MNREQLENQIEIIGNEIRGLKEEIANFEIDPYDYEDSFCASLDCEGSIAVCGMEFMPSYILKELDPIAFRCGLIDYVDGIDIEDNEDYQNLVEKLEDLECDLDELETELSEYDE